MTGLWILSIFTFLGLIAIAVVVFIYTTKFEDIDDRLDALEAKSAVYQLVAETVLIDSANDSVTIRVPSGDTYVFAKGENINRARQIYWTNNYVDPANPYYQRDTHLRFDYNAPDRQFVPSDENTFTSNYRRINLDNTTI